MTTVTALDQPHQPHQPHQAHQPKRLNRFRWFLQVLETWRMQDDEKLQRLDHRDRPDYQQLEAQAGDWEIAQTRIDHLTPIADKRWSNQTKRLVEIAIVILGACTFSTVPQLLGSAANRGAWSTGAGFIGGGAIAWFTHKEAARSLGKLRRRHDSQQALLALMHQHETYPSQNNLVQQFFGAQKNRLRQVEADNLQAQFTVGLILAIGASVLESGAAFLLTLPAGLLLATLAGGFPVLIIWLAALFESESVDFAESAEVVISAYEAYLPDGEVSDEQALRIFVLHAMFKHFTAVHPSQIRTPQGARAKAHSDFAQEQLDLLEREEFEELKVVQQQYRQAHQTLHDRFPAPCPTDFDTAGYRAFDDHPDYQRALRHWQQQITQQEEELQVRFQEDQELIRAEYAQHTRKWQRHKEQADREFQQVEGH